MPHQQGLHVQHFHHTGDGGLALARAKHRLHHLIVKIQIQLCQRRLFFFLQTAQDAAKQIVAGFGHALQFALGLGLLAADVEHGNVVGAEVIQHHFQLVRGQTAVQAA